MPIQFESKGTGQASDVIILVDHWSLWERVCGVTIRAEKATAQYDWVTAWQNAG